jgi:hypothetical protein
MGGPPVGTFFGDERWRLGIRKRENELSWSRGDSPELYPVWAIVSGVGKRAKETEPGQVLYEELLFGVAASL